MSGGLLDTPADVDAQAGAEAALSVGAPETPPSARGFAAGDGVPGNPFDPSAHGAVRRRASPLAPVPAAGADRSSPIVLAWLIRLRWLAVAGQILAIGVAVALVELRYPAEPLILLMGGTVITNLALDAYLRLGRWPVSPSVAPAVLLLDVAVLTALLYFTGGPDNPFSQLFVVHVALATTVMGPRWSWVTVGVVAVCYGVLLFGHQPLSPGEPLPEWAQAFGRSAALLLVLVLLAYFVGRITAALRARESELAAVRERAQINERLAALTTLAAGAAHELGTPLATIAVVAKEMEHSAESNKQPALAEDAALVREQVERCRQILEHLRGDIAGRGSDEPGACDAADVADHARTSLRPERAARLRLDVQRDLPAVAAGQRATQQAVQFLVNNAFDASPHDAPVTLSVGRENGLIVFRVIDLGEGMDEATVRRATEPFFTTKDPGHGMGLGLFLVRLVAERNGGSFELESALDRGTRATLRLPARAPTRH